jgi:uncharacterized membrane protein YecN with MAPEG domain
MNAPITALYAGFTGLLLLALSYQVVRNRMRARVSLGAGEDKGLLRAIRVQANLAEYAPIVLILMLLLELQGASAWLLHGSGAAFVIARVAHAIGMSGTGGISQGRRLGIATTWLVLVVLSIAAIVSWIA